MEFLNNVLGLPKEYLIAGLVTIILGAFSKFCPKEKVAGPLHEFSGWTTRIVEKISLVLLVPARVAGASMSKFLLLKLGKKSAERLEEGIFVTLSLWLDMFLNLLVDGLTAILKVLPNALKAFREGLLSDNEKKENGEGQ